jgi:GR25 family glycosyltransferase involved in LPS biosynthesis
MLLLSTMVHIVVQFGMGLCSMLFKFVTRQENIGDIVQDVVQSIENGLGLLVKIDHDIRQRLEVMDTATSTVPPPNGGTFSMRCINLRRSRERKAFIERQVHACGFISDWKFEEGIDGQVIQHTGRQGSGTYILSDGSHWSYKVTTRHQMGPMDSGVIACTLSHIKAITSFQTEYCMIIEDDAFLSMCHLQEHFNMADIIENAPTDWGIIQLGSNVRSGKSYRRWVSSDRMYGTFIYLIKQSCANQIRSLLVRPDGRIHIDQSLSGEAYIHTDFFLYGLVNVSTDYVVYTHTVFATFNNNTTLDSTLHTENTDRHCMSKLSLITELLESRYVLSLDVPNLINFPLLLTSPHIVPASLCIPCHFGHMSNLRVLLLSLQLQVTMSQEIVISLSSVPTGLDVAGLKKLLQPLVPETPLKLYISHKRQHAGTNRNICIEKSLYDILIFVDADDLMYKNRIQIVYALMSSRPHLASLLHSYTRTLSDTNGEVETSTTVDYRQMLGIAIYDLNLTWIGSTSYIHIPSSTGGHSGFGLKSNGFGGCIHNGHPVLRRSRLRSIRYTDERRGQDAIFNSTLLHHLGREDDTMMIVNIPLTYYLQAQSSIDFVTEP